MKTLSLAASVAALLVTAFASGCAAPTQESSGQAGQESREREWLYPDTTLCGKVTKTGSDLTLKVTAATERTLDMTKPEGGLVVVETSARVFKLDFVDGRISGAASRAVNSTACFTGSFTQTSELGVGTALIGKVGEQAVKCGIVRADDKKENFLLAISDYSAHRLSPQDGSSKNTLESLEGKQACINASWGASGSVKGDEGAALVGSADKIKPTGKDSSREISQN